MSWHTLFEILGSPLPPWPDDATPSHIFFGHLVRMYLHMNSALHAAKIAIRGIKGHHNQSVT